jgi:D-alanyl-D-alanine carboxypeptidase/D-alanyl-D-alanine carboxypeptidase (penicillin-binding protein 5/6)
LDDEEHFTTAYELALITRRALENELFRQIVSTRRATIPHAGTDVTRLLVNHNKMLRLYDGCIGVKTGFTKRSGRCLVSAAERDGISMIAVTLNAPDDWNDHKTLLDHGFASFESVSLCNAGAFQIPMTVVGGKESYVMLSNSEDCSVTLPIGHGRITQTVEIPRFAYASVMQGEQIGKVVWRCDGDGDGYAEVIGEVSLYARYCVERLHIRRSFWEWLCCLFGF